MSSQLETSPFSTHQPPTGLFSYWHKKELLVLYFSMTTEKGKKCYGDHNTRVLQIFTLNPQLQNND